MKRLLSAALCAGLLLGLCACGSSQESAVSEPTSDPAVTEAPAVTETPAATEAPANVLAESSAFADSYVAYLDIRNAIVSEVTGRIDRSNAILMEEQPESYYMDPNYLLLVYVPFSTAYPAVVADAVLQQSWPDAELSVTDGVYRAEFPYEDRTSGELVTRSGACTWEFSFNGAFKVCAYVDGELTEFTEFVPLENDRYLLYTATDLALVEYSGGEVTALWHERRITQPAMDLFEGDDRSFTLDELDLYPSGSVEPDDILSDPDALYTVTIGNDIAVYSGKAAQDILDNDGKMTGVEWITLDPVTLLQ